MTELGYSRTMRTHRFIQTFCLTLVMVVGGAQAITPTAGRQATAAADTIVLTQPERVGFSSESLNELDSTMQGIVDKKQLAGIVTLLARHGKVVQHKAYGLQDIDSRTPSRHGPHGVPKENETCRA